MLKSGIGAAALASVLLSSAAWAQDKIKVGVTATLEGTYTSLGIDGIAGFNAAVRPGTFDDKVLRDLLTQAQQDTRTNVLCAPKITSFNRARASVISRKKVFYVAGVEKAEDARAALRPIARFALGKGLLAIEVVAVV